MAQVARKTKITEVDKKLQKEFRLNSWIPVKTHEGAGVWYKVVGYKAGKIQIRPNGTGVTQYWLQMNSAEGR
jgi:hypothetical protein